MPRRFSKPRTLVTVLVAGLVAGLLGVLLANPAGADADGKLLYTSRSPDEFNIYARVIRLAHAGADNGRLLATFEHHYEDGTPAEFILRSRDDDGETWSTLSSVRDPLSGPGHPVSRMWQPYLFEFPRELGGYPAGTLLLVGNMVPADGASTQFFGWRSTDHGRSWEPIGVLQEGGTFGRGIWEPFLVLDRRGRLLMYFADERDAPRHSQMIVHTTSTDGGDSWGPVVRDVASAVSSDRPGMPTVTRIGARGEYVLSYEVCGRAHCEVRIERSKNGADWGPATELGERPVTTDGRYLGHSPYVTWVPTGQPGGQLVLGGQRVFSVVGDQPTGEDYRAVLVNTKAGKGSWSWAPAPWRASNASPDCNANYSPNLLAEGPPGEVRLTAPTSVGSSGPCGEATGTASIGVLPYADRFGTQGQAGWNTYGGCWRIEADVYAETCGVDDPGIGPKAVTGSTGWTDYTMSVDVKVTSENGDAGLVVRLSDPSVGADSHQGYLAFFDLGQQTFNLARQDYAYQPYASAPVEGGVRPDTWYRLTVTIEGSDLTATMTPAAGGPTTRLDFSDPYDSFRNGMVGLRDHAGTASFRNVNITEPTVAASTVEVR